MTVAHVAIVIIVIVVLRLDLQQFSLVLRGA